MKKLITLAVFGLLGLVGMSARAHANSWFTSQSTGVFISSGAGLNMEVTDVFVGTATAGGSAGSMFLILVDSLTPVGQTSFSFSETAYPVAQWLTPPILLFTTSTYQAQQFIPLTLPTGEGKQFKNGLTAFVIGGGGVKYSVGYRQRISKAIGH